MLLGTQTHCSTGCRCLADGRHDHCHPPPFWATSPKQVKGGTHITNTERLAVGDDLGKEAVLGVDVAEKRRVASLEHVDEPAPKDDYRALGFRRH